VIFVISPVSHVDLEIILLLRWHLAPRLKESSPGFGSLYAYVSECEQISHRLGLLHGYLLHNLDIANPVTEGIDDLNVLDVQNNAPGVAKTFYVIPETLIMLMLDGLQGLSSRWTLVCALEVPDKHGT
jgi:hypothetical protein